jgi:hypothetical protein
MNLDEFRAYVQAERKAQQDQNAVQLMSVVSATIDKKKG